MKATLSFDLDDIDDRQSHFRCVKALDMALALSEVSDLIRKWNKYEPEKFDVEQVTKELRDILDHRDINLEELIR